MNRPSRLDVIFHEHNRAKKQRKALDRFRTALLAGAGIMGGLHLHKKMTGAKKNLLSKLIKK